MKYALIAVVVAVVIIGAYFMVVLNKPQVDYSSATLIFEKSSGWGPCQSGDTCTQSIFLYSNGALKIEGKDATEKNISQENVDRFIKVVKSSGVLEKKCEGEQPADYSATYKFYLDGATTTVSLVSDCQEVIEKVETILNAIER